MAGCKTLTEDIFENWTERTEDRALGGITRLFSYGEFKTELMSQALILRDRKDRKFQGAFGQYFRFSRKLPLDRAGF